MVNEVATLAARAILKVISLDFTPLPSAYSVALHAVASLVTEMLPLAAIRFTPVTVAGSSFIFHVAWLPVISAQMSGRACGMRRGMV